jgi:hypothetical protein
MELVRYYRNGWHVAYLHSRIEGKTADKDKALLVPVIPGKKRIRVPLADVKKLEEPCKSNHKT